MFQLDGSPDLYPPHPLKTRFSVISSSILDVTVRNLSRVQLSGVFMLILLTSQPTVVQEQD